MRLYTLGICCFLMCLGTFAQESPLTVSKIMQDPIWMGSFPSNVYWGEQSETIYFNYNKEKDPADSLYQIKIGQPKNISKLNIPQKRNLAPRYGSYNKAKTKKLFTEDGALYQYNLKDNKKTLLLSLGKRISNPLYLKDENRIGFTFEENAFVLDEQSGTVHQLTQIISGDDDSDKKDKGGSEKDSWVETENLSLLEVVNQRKEKGEASKAYRDQLQGETPYSFYTGKGWRVRSLTIAPNSQYVGINLYKSDANKRTAVPDYIDESGYTKDLNARPKVGDNKTALRLAIYDVQRDTAYLVDTSSLEGLKDRPDYFQDYPDKDWGDWEREVMVTTLEFSPKGEKAVVNIRSKDNKDRWIAELDLDKGSLKVLDRQRDEAWIAGPGIGWSMGGGNLGWLPDNEHIYFQSEVSGYSHLYLLEVATGKKKALTSGAYEVFDPQLSADGKFWYLTTSEVGPGERHFYRMPVYGGNKTQLTTMEGNNQVSLSPDEKYLAIRHSYSNKPWELYLQKNKAGAKAQQLTQGQSEAFKAYPWREPKLVTFTAEDGAQVPARLYKPEANKSNGAAVIFVHGAGYLQNVHKWWSSYFREYMFHNLLTDLGYNVLDIDYRGSAGYGRDWRTGIYRHMGGKDLSDQVDGARYLVAQHGIDSERIGIYGGSYGGFITLMALFNEGDTFTSGAALRSVTDWAHYNHGYTSNILNEPHLDPIAYKRSSPIYFAEGLQGNLLIAHGMVDVNVHFQDVVRLAQRLIELGKDNWEMAVYPAEDHGFVEPSSWTDEYKRILKLFNTTIGGQ